MKFVHGQPVCLGFILGYMLHNAYQTKFINFFKNIQFDIRPEAMKITWEDIDNSLKHFKFKSRRCEIDYVS